MVLFCAVAACSRGLFGAVLWREASKGNLISAGQGEEEGVGPSLASSSLTSCHRVSRIGVATPAALPASTIVPLIASTSVRLPASVRTR